MKRDPDPIAYNRRHNFRLAYGKPIKTEWGKMRPQDFGVMELLDEVDAALQKRSDAGASATPLLLHLRGFFHAILQDQPRTGLRRWLDLRGVQRPASPLAVWLLGRCCTPSSTKRLAELADHPLPSTFAKHYARELRRLRLWDALDRVAVKYQVDWAVARQAERRPSQPFADRLKRYATHVDQSRAAAVPERSRMPLWFSADFWRRTPGKSAQAIRHVLEHLHRLVHGA
ncbi:hypothetical protein KOR34_38170 [Posidoniimonas corsicana]|uniref:Uncharacterized protein n=1 Tax=Posidoniimonas corsicana TaxID=1938618 RepID=A0A5C5V6S5_9BACT|nr:hypothetical protein [Posidoniimonas corsicana]TWT33981.1 hypothetical protein KOR34_38170 [Posidoniimonas corsicana]